MGSEMCIRDRGIAVGIGYGVCEHWVGVYRVEVVLSRQLAKGFAYCLIILISVSHDLYQSCAVNQIFNLNPSDQPAVVTGAQSTGVSPVYALVSIAGGLVFPMLADLHPALPIHRRAISFMRNRYSTRANGLP